MSDRVDQIFEQFKAAHRAGEEVDPVQLLDRLEGTDRAELTALMDAYLTRAPRREWDQASYEQSPAPALVDSLSRSLRGQAGLWPSLLPRLRNGARMKRADLVAELADRLGAGGQREKVAGYYHEMEQGTLPAAGVTDTVLDALGAIVGESRDALRRAGEALGPGPEGGAAGPLFARQASPSLESFEWSRPWPRAPRSGHRRPTRSIASSPMADARVS